MDDIVKIPEFLNDVDVNSNEEIIQIPDFLNPDGLMGTTTIGITSCCETECSMYCMGSEGCSESCGECPSCQNICMFQCQSTMCDTCQTSQGCGEGCGEDCGESSTEASLYFANITENGFGVGLTGLSTTYAGGRTCEWYVNNVYKGTTSVPDGVPSGGYINITGLNSGTTYSVRCDIYRTVTGAFMTTLTGSVSTKSPTRPNNWTWTTLELNAFNNHGDVKTLTWQRWNQFINKIDEFRIYKGLSLVPSIAYMSSSDRVMTATRFNATKLAIGSMYSTGITDRVAGQQVLGSYFVTLSTALNNIQ